MAKFSLLTRPGFVARRCAFLWMAIAAALFSGARPEPPVARAQTKIDPQAAAAIASIVETGWVREGRALDKAIAQHKKARQAAPADWRTDYALGLVYFQHRRFPEAQAALLAAAKAAPEEYVVAESLLWLETYLRQYDAAMTHMRVLAERLSDEAAATASPGVGDKDGDEDGVKTGEPNAERLATLMGQIFGYLGGPAKELVSIEAVEACRADVSDKLPRHLIEPFELGEQAIDDRYVAAQEELEVAREGDAENLARKKEEGLAQLAEERDQLTQEEEGRKAEEAKAQEEYEREVANLEKQIPELQRRATEVRTLAAPIQQFISEINFRIARQLSVGNASADPNIQNSSFTEADRLRFLQRQEEVRLRPLMLEARNIAIQLERLAVQRAQLEGKQQARATALAKARQKADKTSKIVERREKDLGDDRRGSSGRTRAQLAKLAALTSYIKFPLEESKAELLADLKK